MPIRPSETQRQFIGALAAVILGLVLLVVGERLIVYEHLLAEPAKVSGVVVHSGTTLRS